MTKAAPAKAAPKKTTQTGLKPKAKTTASKKRPKPETDDENSSPESASLHDVSMLSSTPPSAKKQKKAHTSKQNGAQPLGELENEAPVQDESSKTKPKKGSNATNEYQRVCRLSSVLMFLDTENLSAHST